MQLCTRISIAHFVFLQLCTCSVHTYVVCIAVCTCCAHLGMVFDEGALNHLQWTMHVRMCKLWSVVSLSYHSLQRGRNAFLLCAMGGHLAVANYLAPKMEGHLFDSDDNGATALHLAAYFGQLSMAEYLVRSCGFDVKAIDKVCLHCLLLVWCVLCPLWTHLLHGDSRRGHLYLSCVNLFMCVSLMWLVFCCRHDIVHVRMYTRSCGTLLVDTYVSSIRFHCVSLTSCAGGQHSTFVGSMERPCRSCSLSAS